MPWEKSFDEDVALERAMQLFWAKGYEATSISDLVIAMDINKGSLYNTFGSKKQLFTRAFLKYDQQTRQATIARLEEMDNPLLAIEVLFDSLVADSVDDVDRKGCLLVNTALELPNHSADVQAIVLSASDDFVQFFERTILAGQKRAQIDGRLDARETATSLLSQAFGLRVLARGALKPDRLNAIRKQALANIAA